MKPRTQPRRVTVVDTTLRDGEQAPGVMFAPTDKLRMARLLDAAGVDEIEVGTPVRGANVQKSIRQIAKLGLNARLTVWCRAHRDDLEAARRCNATAIHVSLPVSPIQLAALGKTESWAISSANAFAEQALQIAGHITIGAQDATRARPAFLQAFADAVFSAGVHRLRLADTVGVAMPSLVAGMVRGLKQHLPGLAIEFHGHNDLGMATANSIMALEAGADAVSVTVGGLGERAGNGALEQLAVALHCHQTLHSAIQTAHLVSLCRLVAQLARRPIPLNQPVVGSGVFAHESGIHCHALLRDHRTYEPFDPSLVGHSNRRLLLGAQSGTAVIRHLLRKAGIHVTADQARALRPFLGQPAQ